MTRHPRHALGSLALLGVLACNEPAPPPAAAPARPRSNEAPAKQPANEPANEPTNEPAPAPPDDDRPPPPPLELGHAIDPEAASTTGGPANPDGPAPGAQPGSASTAALPGSIDRNSALPPEASAGPLPGPPPPATPDHE